ncbi:MAG: glycosyltransferase [Ferruginibacter sp.]
MNIVHVSKSDDRGAFIAAYRFHKQLLAAGHNSVLLVAKKTTTDADVVEVRTNFFEKFYIRSFNFISTLLIKKKTDPRFSFYNYFEDFAYPFAAIKKSLPFRPDIICVHWVTGFINTKILYQLQAATGAAVVWRFNDMNAFTGGCHYNNGCNNYFNSCGNCPALHAANPHDRSYKNLQEKIKWAAKTDITFVSSTSEIDQQLKSSAVAKHAKTKFIMLSCSNNFSQELTGKNEAAVSLGLPPNRKILFFGAQSIFDPRKGFTEFTRSLEILKQSVSQKTAEEILLVYATAGADIAMDLGFETRRIPFLKTDAELAKIYRAATVFVSPSIEEAGPMMLAEAMLCGTPAVAYEIGLAKDALINNVTGFIVPPLNVSKFAEAIQQVVEMNDADYQALSERCSAKAAAIFDQQREMDEYKMLFTHLKNNRAHV